MAIDDKKIKNKKWKLKITTCRFEGEGMSLALQRAQAISILKHTIIAR